MAAFAWGPSLRDPDLDRKLQGVFDKFGEDTYAWDIGSRKVVAVEIISISRDWIDGFLCRFLPRVGLDWLQEDRKTAKIRISGLDHRYPLLCGGERILCAGIVKTADVGMTTLEFHPGVSVVHVPTMAPELHWAICHMFAGGYGGWAQAAEWLQDSNAGFVIDRQVFIDWEPHVTRTCSLNHGTNIDKAPLVPSADFAIKRKIIVEAAIADMTALHAIRMPFNMLATISPPCISWSLGGKGGGFDSIHGMALVDAIELLFASQPNAAMFECADAIKSHHHFPVFGALMNHLGYKQVWEQIIPYHLLANHHRNRWFSVWVRHDVQATAVDNLFRLMVPPIIPWNDSRYHFSLPQQVMQQLRLSPEHMRTYGDLQLLPPAKRSRVQSAESTLQVVRARIPSPSDPLATLCSSYTQQHCLDRNHLERRGIFASITEDNNQFVFLDPVRFIALFGTVTNLAFPLDVAKAFQQIGNAVSVPQALLCFLVTLASTTSLQIPIQETLRKCWLSRIHADTTVLEVTADLVWIRNIVQFVHSLPKPIFHVLAPNAQVIFLDEKFPIEIGAHMSFRELAAMLFRLQFHQMMQIRVEHVSLHPTPVGLALPFIEQTQEFELYLGGYQLCTVQAWDGCSSHVGPSPVIPTPRADQLCPQVTQALCKPLSIEELRFMQVIEALENLNCITLAPSSTFIIWAERNMWAFTPFDGHESQFPARLRTAFEVLIPPAKIVIISLHQNFRWRQGIKGFIVKNSDTMHHAGKCVLQESPNPDGTSAFVVTEARESWPSGTLHNGLPIQVPCQPQDGDIFLVPPQCIRAGGVHDICKKRQVLLPGAMFADRCEFACNTEGWLATDEAWFHIASLNWMTPNIAFLDPVFWDSRVNHLTLSDGTSLGFPNNTISILPVLVDNHWSGVEVMRLADVIQIVFVQVPVELQSRLQTILAGIFDVVPSKLNVTETWPEQHFNMCGWTLLRRWSTLISDEEWQIPVDLSQITPTKLQSLQLAIEASQEDWRAIGIDHNFLRFATQLRTKFLAHLARTTTNLSSAVAQPLSTNVHSLAVNPKTRATTMTAFSGETPHFLFDYLNRRLEDFRCEPTWAASDEIDHALDVARIYASHTLIVTPLLWDPQSASCKSITGAQTPLVGFTEFIAPLRVCSVTFFFMANLSLCFLPTACH